MAVAKQVHSHLLSVLSNEKWFSTDLAKELPLKWEKHGDLVLLPEKTLSSEIWLEHEDILVAICKLLRCNRLARKVGPTQNDDFRSPKIKMLVGASTWVTKKENSILYSWDLSKCMFSSGNITEKQRISAWDLRGKTVVDMYSGIGYFTLTYLVHCKADMVYACEWNPDAVEALKSNLSLNKISLERCIIRLGDNQLTCPKDVADHVNLGLIPSSENSWKSACNALKRSTGGLLHVHGNVDTKLDDDSETEITSSKMPPSYNTWSTYVCSSIQKIFADLYPSENWKISVESVFKIKSYAPRVDHLVVDISCKPVSAI